MLAIENLIYPPSFQVLAISHSARVPSFVKIQFSVSEDKTDDFIVTLPLCCNLASASTFSGKHDLK